MRRYMLMSEFLKRIRKGDQMINPLQVWRGNGKAKKDQELKNRVLKNREGVLDAFAENIKGARACPLLMGQKCIGGLCELFGEYKSVDKEGRTTTYNRCNFNQTPILLIENANLMRSLINEQRQTQKLLIAIYEKEHGEINNGE